MNDFGESRELFQLRSGRVILDEDMYNSPRKHNILHLTY